MIRPRLLRRTSLIPDRRGAIAVEYAVLVCSLPLIAVTMLSAFNLSVSSVPPLTPCFDCVQRPGDDAGGGSEASNDIATYVAQQEPPTTQVFGFQAILDALLGD